MLSRLRSAALAAVLPTAALISVGALAYGCHMRNEVAAVEAAAQFQAAKARAVQTAARADTVRWRVDTVRDTVLSTVTRWRLARTELHTQIVAAVAANDSVAALHALVQMQAAGDSVVRACTHLMTTCDQALAAKDTALRAQVRLTDETAARLRTTADALSRAQRRWRLGVTAGPAIGLVDQRAAFFPAVTVGLSYRVW